MECDFESMEVLAAYQLMVGLVTPRPIAWVTTLDRNGTVNLAPFSFFNLFGANPPVVGFSPSLRMNGTKKDTLLNIEHHGEFVIHGTTSELAEAVNTSSKELPYGESELELLAMSTIPSKRIATPRIEGAPYALECRLMQIIPLGNGPISGNLVLGQVLHAYVDERILDPQGLPDPKQMRSIARLGSNYWCHISDVFQQQRPS